MAASGKTPFPASRIAGFGLPLVLAMGGHALFNLVDLWVVGALGPAALAAVTVASLVNGIPMVVLQGVSDGAVAMVARAAGEGDLPKAGAAARQAVLLALLLGVLLGVPPWLASRPLAAACGAEGDALDQAAACLGVLSLGSITMFLLMQAAAVLRALGSARAPFYLLLGANGLNLVLAIGLVYGKFGLPAWGVVGACWATVIARGVFAALGLVLMARSPLALRFAGPGFRGRTQWTLLRLGLPVAGQWIVRLVPVLVVLRLCGRLGTEAQAAYGIASRLDQLALFATVGWGAAAATAVGQGLGAGDPAGAARAAWRAVLYGVLTMAAAGAAYAVFAPDLVRLVGREDGARPEVVAFAAGYLRTLAWGYPALGLAIVLSLALSGAGSVKTALVLDGCFLVAAFVPLALHFAPAGSRGPVAPLWWSLVGVFGALGAAYAGVFLLGRWKAKRL